MAELAVEGSTYKKQYRDALKAAPSMGIRAESLRTETQDSIEFTVRIPKEFACRNAG